MNDPAFRLATYEDLFDLPEHVIGEILNGQLITRPRHSLAASVIGDEYVSPYHRGRGGSRLLEHTWQNDDVDNAPPFDAVSLTLDDLWVPLPEGKTASTG